MSNNINAGSVDLSPQNLKKALEEKQFFLEYQPQYDLRTSHIVGIEALVRLKNPVKGIVAPDMFVPLIQEAGLMRQLTCCVLEEAFSCLKEVFPLKQIKMAVNLSATQFEDASFVDFLQRKIQENNIPTTCVELEITESLLVNKKADGFIKDLSRLGVSLAIDDFGIGYSSLSYLARFPINKIKIDKSFVLGLEENKKNEKIIKAIIGLGKELETSVVAEGCETSYQLNALKTLDCPFAQGFYLSRPLLINQVKELLVKEKITTKRGLNGKFRCFF